MLQIIDQRWREHLSEMDYLREGINLRAMGQQDPLVAWQREGFKMFGQLMDSIDDDYLRYVLHVQVVAEAEAEPDLSKASYVAADDPVGRGQPPRGLPGHRPRGRRPGRARPAAPAAARPRPTAGGRHQVEDDPGAPGEGPDREARAQRPVLVRERPEVQAVPWRGVSRPAPASPATCGRELAGPAHPADRGRALPRASAPCGPGTPSSRRRSRAPTCGTTPRRPRR